MRVVIVDNGRTNALADPEMRGVLRAFAGRMYDELSSLSPRRRWAYGWVYPGPCAVLTPYMQGLKTAGLPFASSLRRVLADLSG